MPWFNLQLLLNVFNVVRCRIARKDRARIRHPSPIHVESHLGQPMTSRIHRDDRGRGHGKKCYLSLSFISRAYIVK